MSDHAWIEEFPAAATVIDLDGKIIAMNNKSAKTFSSDGERDLIGKSAFDCHPPAAQAKLKELLITQGTNVYTIEKKGVKKLIYQGPWYRDGKFAGIVELSLEIPFEMPHFIRQ